MSNEKKYFQDKIVLLLLSVNSFLTLLGSVMILLKVGNSGDQTRIIQYRPELGLSAFNKGGTGPIYAFVLFVWFIMIFHTFMSVKTYNLKKDYSILMLAFCLLLLSLAIIVSNSLLALP
ncbi:MAG TPA: hypothetical protein VMR34_06045 [Candidatus Saccharimonadales bacterium]|nr:hypothetical protein [Candidatus Saccharimonadales bacterium]